MSSMRVLLAGGGTGGHLMPALALARSLTALEPRVEILLVGAERGIERHVLPQHPYRFRLLPLEPLYRRTWWRNARWLGIAWRLWREVNELLDQERPDVVVSTGGYAAGPVVWRAQRRGIPTALQEQNAFPGLTTRWLARGARHVYLGLEEARPRLGASRSAAVFTFGNPIEPPPAGGADRNATRREFGLDGTRPCVLLFGGSQGARALNDALAGALDAQLLDGVHVLWGTGIAHTARFARYAVAGHIVVRGFFDPIAPAYGAADLVVCRAGAMTIAELCAWGKASLLVPLPTAAADHQTYNARALSEAGAGVALAEAELTPQSLARLVSELVTDRARLESLGAHAKSRGHPNAARLIASAILALGRGEHFIPPSLSQVS